MKGVLPTDIVHFCVLCLGRGRGGALQEAAGSDLPELV